MLGQGLQAHPTTGQLAKFVPRLQSAYIGNDQSQQIQWQRCGAGRTRMIPQISTHLEAFVYMASGASICLMVEDPQLQIADI